MDMKEIGGCAMVVIGGVVYGVSSGGLSDALSDGVEYVHDVPYAERSEYMDGIISTFTDSFDTYIVQTDTYDYLGHSKFSAFPAKATFREVVRPDEKVPAKEMAAIKTQVSAVFCAQEEMTMFTDKGWNYSFSLQDEGGRPIVNVTCKADLSKLKQTNQDLS